MTGIFELDGQEFICLDGGAMFETTGAISIVAELDTQEELDGVWEKITDGGQAIQCGWVTDKFGVTWQINPKAFGEMMSDPSATPEQKKALMEAMMPMVKLDIAPLKAAFEAAKQ